MSRPVRSKRSMMRELFEKHPDWTYQQYADAVGSRVESVRSYRSMLRTKERDRKAEEEAEKAKQKKTLKKPVGVQQVSSTSTRSRSSGYLKLI